MYRAPGKETEKVKIVMKDMVLDKLLDAFAGLLARAEARGKEKEYDLDTKITLACGTVIVPRKKWANKKKDDNTPRFINEVKLMYYSPAKIIDVEINVLR